MRIIRGTLTDVAAESGKIARATVHGSGDEQIDSVEIFSNIAGVTAIPNDQTECVAVQSGHRTIIVGTADRRNSPDLDTGDVAVHAASDQYIILKANGNIEIKCKTGSQVNINNGNLTVDA